MSASLLSRASGRQRLDGVTIGRHGRDGASLDGRARHSPAAPPPLVRWRAHRPVRTLAPAAPAALDQPGADRRRSDADGRSRPAAQRDAGGRRHPGRRSARGGARRFRLCGRPSPHRRAGRGRRSLRRPAGAHPAAERAHPGAAPARRPGPAPAGDARDARPAGHRPSRRSGHPRPYPRRAGSRQRLPDARPGCARHAVQPAPAPDQRRQLGGPGHLPLVARCGCLPAQHHAAPGDAARRAQQQLAGRRQYAGFPALRLLPRPRAHPARGQGAAHLRTR